MNLESKNFNFDKTLLRYFLWFPSHITCNTRKSKIEIVTLEQDTESGNDAIMLKRRKMATQINGMKFNVQRNEQRCKQKEMDFFLTPEENGQSIVSILYLSILLYVHADASLAEKSSLKESQSQNTTLKEIPTTTPLTFHC